jgi:hypothetical protein
MNKYVAYNSNTSVEFLNEIDAINFASNNNMNIKTINVEIIDEGNYEIITHKDRLNNQVFLNLDSSYRIYKYVSEDVAQYLHDTTLPPHGLDYIVSVEPKFKAIRVFDKGFLTNVTWWTYNYDNNTYGEEILKVNIEYVQVVDTTMNSANSVVSRTTTRQWILENNTYKNDLSDVKITKKNYNTAIERNEEGKVRRNNIFVGITEKYVILLMILETQGDQILVQNIGKQMLSEISSSVSDYISIGSVKIFEELDLLNNIQYNLDFIIPNVSPFTIHFNNGIGLTIREYLKELLKGNI